VRLTTVVQTPSPLRSSASHATRPTPIKAMPLPGSLPIEPSGRMNFVLPAGKQMSWALGRTTAWNQSALVRAAHSAMPLRCSKNFLNHGT